MSPPNWMAGSMVPIMVKNMAASWLRTRAEAMSPRPVALSENSTMATVSAARLPVSGTSNTVTASSSIMAKLNSDSSR